MHIIITVILYNIVPFPDIIISDQRRVSRKKSKFGAKLYKTIIDITQPIKYNNYPEEPKMG